MFIMCQYCFMNSFNINLKIYMVNIIINPFIHDEIDVLGQVSDRVGFQPG